GAAEAEELSLDSIEGWSGSKDQLLWVDIVADADQDADALAAIDDRLGLDGKLKESSQRGPTGIRFSGRAIGLAVTGRGGWAAEGGVAGQAVAAGGGARPGGVAASGSHEAPR